MRIVRDAIKLLWALALAALAIFFCPETYCNATVQVEAHDVNLKAELPVINQAALRNDCNGANLFILYAIRMSEKGGPGREFGILDPEALALIEQHPERGLDIQAGWAAATIIKNRKRWDGTGNHKDFIKFLGDKYCPKETDPKGNKNWKRNVIYWFTKFKEENE